MLTELHFGGFSVFKFKIREKRVLSVVSVKVVFMQWMGKITFKYLPLPSVLNFK